MAKSINGSDLPLFGTVLSHASIGGKDTCPETALHLRLSESPDIDLDTVQAHACRGKELASVQASPQLPDVKVVRCITT